MALFFRGETRKFFLILLGQPRSEKNRVGFGRELREFSRRVVGGGWAVGRLGGWAVGRLGGWAVGRLGGWAVGRLGGWARWVGACLDIAGDERDVGRWYGGGCSGPVRQGFGGEAAACSPMECTAFGVIAGAGCPQCRGCRPSGRSRSPFDRTGFRVASCAGCPHLDLSAVHADADAHRRNSQRDESMPAGDIHTAGSLRGRCDVRAQRPDAQGRESIRRQDIHMAVRPSCAPLGSRARRRYGCGYRHPRTLKAL